MCREFVNYTGAIKNDEDSALRYALSRSENRVRSRRAVLFEIYEMLAIAARKKSVQSVNSVYDVRFCEKNGKSFRPWRVTTRYSEHISECREKT